MPPPGYTPRIPARIQAAIEAAAAEAQAQLEAAQAALGEPVVEGAPPIDPIETAASALEQSAQLLLSTATLLRSRP
jgi:nucleotide-binding universal stress UspA family protein